MIHLQLQWKRKTRIYWFTVYPVTRMQVFTTSPSPPPPPPQRPSPTTATNCPPNCSSSYSCLLLPLTLLLLLQLLLLTPAPAAVHSPPPHQHQHQDYRHFLHRQHLPLFSPPVSSFYSKFLWVQNYISFSFSWNSNIKSLCRPKVKNLYNCLFLEFEMGWPKNCTFVIYVWDLAFLLIVGNSCLAN